MRPIIILVAGGSASGKTTLVNEIIREIDSDELTVIKHDDYYNDLSHLTIEERKLVNYDHPKSLDNELLIENLNDLIMGKEIKKPLYDYTIHNRKKEYEVVKPTKVIIIEGILILENKHIRDLADIKIFVQSDDDIRFIRRLKRDMEKRARTLEDVIRQYLTTVKPMFNEYVKPTAKYADIIIPNDNSYRVAKDFLVSKIKEIIKK